MRTPTLRGSALQARSALPAVLATIAGLLAGQAQAQSVKIVGIGASTCHDFLREIAGRPDVEKNFFAWAQGYMSGLLIRAPAGKDENLDLTPPAFPLGGRTRAARNRTLRSNVQ